MMNNFFKELEIFPDFSGISSPDSGVYTKSRYAFIFTKTKVDSDLKNTRIRIQNFELFQSFILHTCLLIYNIQKLN